MTNSKAGPTLQEVLDSMTESQKTATYWFVGKALSWKERTPRKSVKAFWKDIASFRVFTEGVYLRIYDEMTEEQRTLVSLLVSEVIAPKLLLDGYSND